MRKTTLAALLLTLGCASSETRDVTARSVAPAVAARGLPAKVGVHIQLDGLYCVEMTGDEIGSSLGASDEVFIHYAWFHSGPNGSPKKGAETATFPSAHGKHWGNVDPGDWVFLKPHHVCEVMLADGEFVIATFSVQEQDKGPDPGNLEKMCGPLNDALAVAEDKGSDYAMLAATAGASMLWTHGLGEALELLGKALGAIDSALGGGPHDRIGEFQIIVWNRGGVLKKELRMQGDAKIKKPKASEQPFSGFKRRSILPWIMSPFGTTKLTPNLVLDGNPGSPQRYLLALSVTTPNKKGKWKRVTWKKENSSLAR